LLQCGDKENTEVIKSSEYRYDAFIDKVKKKNRTKKKKKKKKGGNVDDELSDPMKVSFSANGQDTKLSVHNSKTAGVYIKYNGDDIKKGHTIMSFPLHTLPTLGFEVDEERDEPKSGKSRLTMEDNAEDRACKFAKTKLGWDTEYIMLVPHSNGYDEPQTLVYLKDTPAGIINVCAFFN
jgi:hypothetical protein